jgi:hypothetical protein
MLTDIGLDDPNVQIRKLGEHIRSTRRLERWSLSSLDFRSMERE